MYCTASVCTPLFALFKANWSALSWRLHCILLSFAQCTALLVALSDALMHTTLWWDFCNLRHTAVNLESYCTPDEVENEISILSTSSPGDIFPRPCWPLHPSWCLHQQYFSLITTVSSIYKSLFRANYFVHTAKCAGSLYMAWVWQSTLNAKIFMEEIVPFQWRKM